MTGNRVGVQGIRMLSEGLKTNYTLTELNLWCSTEIRNER